MEYDEKPSGNLEEDQQDFEEFSFLQETIKMQPMGRQKTISLIIRIAGFGLIFGACACLGFFALRPLVEPSLQKNPDTITLKDDSKNSGSELKGNEEEIAAEISKSIVSVEIDSKDERDKGLEEYDKVSSMTGIVMADNGQELLILVSSSVLKNESKAMVTFVDGSKYEAVLKKKDNNLGIAILYVTKSEIAEGVLPQIAVAKLGNSNEVVKGEAVFAIGNQFGYANGLGYGNISTIEYKQTLVDGTYGLLMTDIAAAESGTGALVTMGGQIIGLIDQKISDGDSMNLVTAIGVSDLKGAINILSNGSNVPHTGMKITEVPEEIKKEKEMPKGIYVQEVTANSAGMQAGIQNGDILTHINNTEIETMEVYQEELLKYKVGDQVRFTGKRQGASGYIEINFVVTLRSYE